MVRDLMNLMPDPAPLAGDELFRLWGEHVNALSELDQQQRRTAAAKLAEQELSLAIKQSRAAVAEVLTMLD